MERSDNVHEQMWVGISPGKWKLYKRGKWECQQHFNDRLFVIFRFAMRVITEGGTPGSEGTHLGEWKKSFVLGKELCNTKIFL